MRFLLNVNSLLQCSHSHIIKSSRQFRWNFTATAYLPASDRLLHTANLRNRLPKIDLVQNVQKFMSTNSFSKDSSHNSTANTKHSTVDEDDIDGVSIYEGKITKQIVRVKMFSITTSAMGLLAQPIIWTRAVEASGTGLGTILCSIVGIFTFVTPVLLHFVTKKYVIDIRYNEQKDEYTCATVSFFLFKNKVGEKNLNSVLFSLCNYFLYFFDRRHSKWKIFFCRKSKQCLHQ